MAGKHRKQPDEIKWFYFAACVYGAAWVIVIASFGVMYAKGIIP